MPFQPFFAIVLAADRNLIGTEPERELSRIFGVSWIVLDDKAAVTAETAREASGIRRGCKHQRVWRIVNIPDSAAVYQGYGMLQLSPFLPRAFEMTSRKDLIREYFYR